MSRYPKKSETSNSESEKEIAKVEKQFEKFEAEIKTMTMDQLNTAPKQEVEPQTKLSTKEIENSTDLYLKPIKTIFAVDAKTGKGQKFNEAFKEQCEYDKQYVQFIAENKETPGEILDIWTRPYGGMPAEEWRVPTNKPVWGPRYLAEQIKRKYYHRLVMQDKSVGADGVGQYYGTMTSDTTIQRLDAHPVSKRKSIFMGATNF